MKQIAVLSGKGGTGKTSITASFAQLMSEKIVIGDCDVDASNMALLIHGKDYKEDPFYAGTRAVIDTDACTGCGNCVDVCRYNAVEIINNKAVVDIINCEGCNACAVVCPEDAITFKTNRSGTVYERETQYGPLVHAALGIAQDNSGKLVSTVKESAKKLAEDNGYSLILLDGPPGIGCPVHATLTGIDLVVAVTEPSVAGHHDLQRLFDVCTHFNLPLAVIINKSDLSPELTNEIEIYAASKNMQVVGKIPFNREIPVFQSKGLTPVEIPEIKTSLKKSLDIILDIIK